MTFCPHCGHNLTADEPITRAPYRLHTNEAWRHSTRLPLTAQEAAFLHSLAKAYPRVVSTEALANRISAAAYPENVIAVVARRIRIKLGEQTPFETVRGQGYRWAA